MPLDALHLAVFGFGTAVGKERIGRGNLITDLRWEYAS